MLKKLPHSPEAERGVLGSILLEPEAFERVDLKPDDFYEDRHSLLFGELQKMSASGRMMDAITISEWLKDSGSLEAVGGYEYLVELQSDTIVPSHVEQYVEKVEKTRKLRMEIDACAGGLDIAYSGESASDRVISSLMSLEKEEQHTVAGIVDRWKQAQDGDIPTVPTPYPDLDRLTGALRMGLPHVFTGRSKAGKSMFLASWYNYLGQRGIPALVLPFEDDYDITITRMAANLGGYKWSRIENGGEWVFHGGKKDWDKVTSMEIKKAKECLEAVSKYPIFFHEMNMTPCELPAKVARYKRKHGIRAFFIDGAKDFIKPSGKYNDVGFDEECSQIVKRTCKQHNQAGIVVHHLTKISETDLITASNVRGSGNIIGDSRSVYALQSSGLEQMGVYPDTDDWGRITTRVFQCLANNHGGTGYVALESDLARCRFWVKE